MSSPDSSLGQPATFRYDRSMRLVLPVFTASIFLSAFLLFAVQPMFTKMVLPRLGGTPAVWSVAMVFFQGLLLLGYLYAHLSARWLPTRIGILLHLALLTLTALALPIGLSRTLGDPPGQGEATWLLGVFAASVGLPFFAVAGNGPLLQTWFSRSGHRHAADPYFLYAASNLGSFAALLLYPVLFEPLLSLSVQSSAWAFGFAALIAAIAVSGGCLIALGADVDAPKATTAVAAAGPDWGQRLTWVAYAFVPSGLLVAVTAYVSTDIASAPLLWIIPLALFLLTFVLVFRDRPVIPHMLVVRAWPIVAAALMVAMYRLQLPIGVMLALHVGGFFLAALLCHGELYARRPAAGHLTGFYLWMSAGGVLGGLFAGLASPHLFDDIYEYPILIALALLCLPAATSRLRWRGILEAVAIAACAWLVVETAPMLRDLPLHARAVLGTLLSIAPPLLLWLWRETPLRSAAIAAFGFVALNVTLGGVDTVAQMRSFFGVNRVRISEDGRLRLLVHGNTIHGAMQIRDAAGQPVSGRPEPTTYYYPGGPLDTAIETTRQAFGGKLGRVAVAGLGAGSLACRARPGEDWSFFEIDPDVIRIARDPALFRFLSDCDPSARIVTGDARLTLAKERGPFDLILLDAFSSDAIPMHLLTREALQLYLSRLAPHGTLVLHITNRHLELRSVVAAEADALGLSGLARLEGPQEAAANGSSILPAGSHVVVLARDPADFARLRQRPGWQPLEPVPGVSAWTDDYSNIIGPLLRR